MPTKDPRVLARINALLARAADAGATEEERRTSAVIAARLMKEHGVTIGGVAPEPIAAERTDRFRAALASVSNDPRVQAAFDAMSAELSDLARGWVRSMSAPSRAAVAVRRKPAPKKRAPRAVAKKR